MERFNAERKPNEESGGEVPPEIIAANDAFFDEFFSTESLALRALGEEFVRRKFALSMIREKISKDPNSLFINSLRFTEEDIAFECERIANQIKELGPKNELNTDKYFETVEEIVMRVGKDRRQNKTP